MNHKIIFEVIPCQKTASEASMNKFLERISNAVNELKNVSLLNIPEIVEENYAGLPYYRNADNRKFGALLREKCGKEVMLNTVVVHYDSNGGFEKWLDESVNNYDVKNFVFVGAKINGMKYPGPSIMEANSIAKRKSINFGNIFIPERENEADRLVGKTASGCNFFTSQVLFGADKAVNALREYSIKCEKAGLKPAKFFLSFSPISSLEDVAFFKWLGAEIRGKTESRLRTAQNIGEESIKIIIDAFQNISGSLDENGIKVPLGLNIEYITLHNLELSKNLANMLSDLKMVR